MDINFDDLTIENLAYWPSWLRFSLVVLSFITTLSLGYGFDIKTQCLQLKNKQVQEKVLKTSLATKQQLAANLAQYRHQLTLLTKKLNKLLQQLPTRSQMPGLLENISRIGAANGLDFKLFKSQPEEKKGFYAELPIKIVVVGNYHQIARFISQICALDHMVTLHNFTLKTFNNKSKLTQTQIENKKQQGKLILDITAKTYRYIGMS